MRNALTDIAWIPTDEGLMTPRETLLRAHRIRGIDTHRAAFEVSSTLRFLAALTAVVLQAAHAQDEDHRDDRPLPEAAIDSAIAEIGGAADLDDPAQPFFQRPPLAVTGPRDTTRSIGERDGSVRKLSPAINPESAQAFWQLSMPTRTSLPLEEAVLALVVFHEFFPGGNNSYAGDKTVMGSPAWRYPGKENTATEVIWRGESLLDTLLRMIPRTWVREEDDAPGGLPAWADRGCERSTITLGQGAPARPTALWSATWSSNAAACRWDGDELVGVRVGGIPTQWAPPELRHSPPAQWKPWWDNRNLSDPFYLYAPNRQNEMKAVRLDLGRNVTELAVEWNSQNRFRSLQSRSANRVLPAPPQGMDLVFLRHQVFGTASSPSIRASQVFRADKEHWAPDADAAEAVSDFAGQIQKLHYQAIRPFLKRPSNERARPTLTGVFTSDALAKAASAAFWRRISTVFDDAMDDIGSRGIDQEIARRAVHATVDAVVEATEPMRHQRGHTVEHLRAQVEREARAVLRRELKASANHDENSDAGENNAGENIEEDA